MQSISSNSNEVATEYGTCCLNTQETHVTRLGRTSNSMPHPPIFHPDLQRSLLRRKETLSKVKRAASVACGGSTIPVHDHPSDVDRPGSTIPKKEVRTITRVPGPGELAFYILLLVFGGSSGFRDGMARGPPQKKTERVSLRVRFSNDLQMFFSGTFATDRDNDLQMFFCNFCNR